MTKPRKKPAKLVDFQTSDTGPDTSAQKFGAIYKAPEGGRPGDKRKTKQHPLERMASHGAITDQQKEAGIAVLNLYERALPSGGGLSEFVERSMDCGAVAALTCEAGMRYAKAVRFVSSGPMTAVFSHVVLDGLPLIQFKGCRTSHAERQRKTRLLRVALDRLCV
jgi:hypothetical protein